MDCHCTLVDMDEDVGACDSTCIHNNFCYDNTKVEGS